jgi:Tfp pilus assembly protein PilF
VHTRAAQIVEQVEEADALFRRALALEPGNAEAHVQHGKFRELFVGDVPGAEAAYRQAPPRPIAPPRAAPLRPCAPRPARRAERRLRLRGDQALAIDRNCLSALAFLAYLLRYVKDGRAPPRNKWTHRVPHPVLIGHAAPLTPY